MERVTKTKQPLELIRVGNTGVLNFVVLPTTEWALCAFLDGTIGVFHMGRRQVEWMSTAGHTETVFDAAFKPSDGSTLATCSYDSTVVRLWNIHRIECRATFQGQTGILYSVAWAPGKQSGLACRSGLCTLGILL